MGAEKLHGGAYEVPYKSGKPHWSTTCVRVHKQTQEMLYESEKVQRGQCRSGKVYWGFLLYLALLSLSLPLPAGTLGGIAKLVWKLSWKVENENHVNPNSSQQYEAATMSLNFIPLGVVGPGFWTHSAFEVIQILLP